MDENPIYSKVAYLLNIGQTAYYFDADTVNGLLIMRMWILEAYT